jgi:hypothetical protein
MASKTPPTTHNSKPATATATRGFGVGPVTAESCSGSETNHVAEHCSKKTWRAT